MKIIVFSLLMIVSSYVMAEERIVPPEDAIHDLLFNYHEVLPHLATSGKITADTVPELKSLGFKSILDLRTPPEGVAKIQEVAHAHNLSFLSIPVGRDIPDENSLKKFSRWIENENHHPVLVYCASGNRAGLMWGIYRVRSGVSLKKAFDEATEIGMRGSRGQQLIEFSRQPKYISRKE